MCSPLRTHAHCMVFFLCTFMLDLIITIILNHIALVKTVETQPMKTQVLKTQFMVTGSGLGGSNTLNRIYRLTFHSALKMRRNEWA